MLGKLRFSVAVPLVWNSLALDVRTANSLPVFKNNLKTFLFLCHRVPLITGLSSWFWRYINFIISISKQYNQHEYVEKIWPYDQTNGTNNRQTDSAWQRSIAQHKSEQDSCWWQPYSGFFSRASFADLIRVCWLRSRQVVCITDKNNKYANHNYANDVINTTHAAIGHLVLIINFLRYVPQTFPILYKTERGKIYFYNFYRKWCKINVFSTDFKIAFSHPMPSAPAAAAGSNKIYSAINSKSINESI